MAKKEVQKELTENEDLPQKKQNSDKQLMWIFGIMLGIVAVFLVSYSFFQDSKSFDYQGLTFTKEKFGDILFYKYSYSTDKPGITGSVVDSKGMQQVNLLLRDDPRKNLVSVDGKIEYLRREKFVYISINSTGITCEKSTIAIANLASFLSQNGFNPEPGVPDEAEAKEMNLTYVTCENRPNNMVILLQSGNQNSIVRKDNCYTVTIADCDIIAPTEKFIVQSIIDAKEPQTEELAN